MLIVRESNPQKTQFRIRMSQEIFDEISEYCKYTGIRFRDYFIEEACKYIFKHDKDWQSLKESKSTQENR